MQKLGRKQLTLQLRNPLKQVPSVLSMQLELSATSRSSSTPSTRRAPNRHCGLLKRLGELGIDFTDLKTDQSSLEDIFVASSTSLPNDPPLPTPSRRLHEHSRHPRHLQVRAGPHLAHAGAEHSRARHLHVAVLRGVRLGIGKRMSSINGVSYGAFIVRAHDVAVLSESISNASFGIYMRKWSGTIYEILSAPVSYLEIVIGYVGSPPPSPHPRAIILITARLFVPFTIVHPIWMVSFLCSRP